MKRVGLILSILMLTVTAAACGLIGESEDAGNKVTIQYWHTQTEEERVSHLKTLIDKFEQEHPTIRVKQVPVPEADFPTKITASLAGNRMPAIIEAGIDQAFFLASEDALDTKIHKEIIDEVGKDDFYQGALKTMEAKNGAGYYGVPISGWVQGIWYRKDLFKKKGLQPPTDWKSIERAAKAFHQPERKKYGIVMGTAKDDFTEQSFSQFALSNDAVVFNHKGNVDFHNKNMVESLQYYKQLSAYTPPGAESWREAREMLLNGYTPMVVYSSYIMSDLVAADLAGVTGFATPKNTSEATFGQINSMAIINTVSKRERRAAKEFTSFLMEKENNINYLHMSPGGLNPTRKSIAQSPDYLDNEVLKTFGKEAVNIASGLDNLKRFGFQDGVTYPEMGDISARFIIGEAIYNMTERNESPANAAKKAEEKMKNTVEK